MKVISTLIVALVLFLSFGSSAKAQVEIYGIGSFDGLIAVPCCPPCEIGKEECLPCACEDTLETKEIPIFLGESGLYKVDPNTGFPYFIGYTGFGACRGLDIHPISGEFYAVCNRLIINGPPGPPGDPGMNRNDLEEGQVLVHIDQQTGYGTEIGPLGEGIGGLLRGGFVSDISFYPDGTLYAHLNDIPLYKPAANPNIATSNGIYNNMLGTINLQTGAFQPIGPTHSDDFVSAIGFSNLGDLIQCANFDDNIRKDADQDNKFLGFYFTNINELNIGTGLASFLRQASFPPDVEGHLNVITSKDVDMESGTFYGFLRTEFDLWVTDVATRNIESGSYLVRIHPSNGNVEIIGLTSPPFENFLAIAVKQIPRNVPTMSEYGLMLTVALFLGAAVVFLRRRKAKQGA